MAVSLIVAPEALQDIRSSYAWYEQRRVGLGEEFLSCIEACIGRIQRVPEGHPVVHQNFRRALVRRFPFAVFYECEKDVVTVYAIFHHSRDPQKWKERSSI